MGMGVDLRLEVQADRQIRQTHAAGARSASQAHVMPGPHGHMSALPYEDDRVHESARWLQAALATMIVVHLRDYTLCTSPGMRAKRTRGLNISKSTCRGVCNGDVTLVPGVGRRGARTCPCSRAAAAVWRGFAAQITKRWLRKISHWAGVCGTGGTRISAECSASGGRLSTTVWSLTRALRTWWRFCSDEGTPWCPKDAEGAPEAVLSRGSRASPGDRRPGRSGEVDGPGR